MSDDYTQAEIVRSLQRIEKAQQDGDARTVAKFTELAALVTSQGTTFVTRVEFDLVTKNHDREIKEVKDEAEARGSSTRTNVSLILAGLAVIASVVLPFVAR